MLRFKQMAARAVSRWLIVAGLLGLLISEAMAGSPTADRLPATLAPLLTKVLPAVVSIRVIGKRHVVTELKPGVEPPQPKAHPFKSGGSGVIFDAEQGLIGTNHHVIKDAVAINVGLHDGRSTPAKLVGIDIGTDIAILKIDLPGLTALPLGNSDSVKIGDFVIAVGNPYGLEGTATAGIVSGLMRSEVGYEIFESFIQTDAAVNPGNSGGALVNLQGDLIGVNTAIAGGGSNIGIGFAIPINMARRIGRQIVLHGRMPRGAVGVTTQDISADAAQAVRGARGALISHVDAGSPAQAVGLAIGQVIVGINGDVIRTNADYMSRLGSSAIGDTLEFDVAAKDTVKKVKVTMTDFKPAAVIAAVPRDTSGIGGLVVASIGPGSPLYGEIRGVVIQQIEPQSPAQRAGFNVGDVIVAINQQSIMDAGQIAQLVDAGTSIDRVQISRNRLPYALKFSP
jgi:serine protease Do